MAEKFCIFCGNKPKDKNMEHVIPQWLIKMTGREKKDVFSLYPENSKHLTFMNYKFPACEACNTKYAEMEAKVKPVMEKVLEGKTITGQEASLLMDWFDKIRIGLWLAEMFYDKDLRKNVAPHMFIDSRVGRKDRLLSIQKLDIEPEKHGILFGGTTTPWFNYAPCAFVMLVNNYYFFNASMDALISQRTGFPYVVNAKLSDASKGRYWFDIVKGIKRVVNPIVQTFIPNQNALAFYQPIFKDYVCFADKYIQSDYVEQHCYDIKNGLGGVFAQHGNKANIRYLNQDDKIGVSLRENPVPNIAQDIIKFQIAIGKKSRMRSPETENGLQFNEFALSQMQQKTK